MKLRLVPRRDGYMYEGYFYECKSSEPILTLQQWWQDDEYPLDETAGDWLDVPIERLRGQ